MVCQPITYSQYISIIGLCIGCQFLMDANQHFLLVFIVQAYLGGFRSIIATPRPKEKILRKSE